jgi:hypothetical protein
MGQPLSSTDSLVILLSCTAAILLLTYVWAFSNMRPVRRHPVHGRPAAPYWHHPSGMQTERGIRSVDEP